MIVALGVYFKFCRWKKCINGWTTKCTLPCRVLLCVYTFCRTWRLLNIKTFLNPSEQKVLNTKQWRSKSSPNYVTAFCLEDLHPFSTTIKMHVYFCKFIEVWQMNITYSHTIGQVRVETYSYYSKNYDLF